MILSRRKISISANDNNKEISKNRKKMKKINKHTEKYVLIIRVTQSMKSEYKTNNNKMGIISQRKKIKHLLKESKRSFTQNKTRERESWK